MAGGGIPVSDVDARHDTDGGVWKGWGVRILPKSYNLHDDLHVRMTRV